MKALGLPDGKMILASRFGQSSDEAEALELSEEEKALEENVKVKMNAITTLYI